jgi:4-hydroxythreonine-4-phosphate dehydrogenase
MNTPTRLALTMGDPAGIGPEIIAKAAHQLLPDLQQGRLSLRVLGSAQAYERALRDLGLDTLQDLRTRVQVDDVGPVTQAVVVGQIGEAGGHWAYRAVERAVRLCQSGEADAIVTAPLCKEALHLAGYPFEGHTEMLAHLSGERDGVMMLAHGNMRVSHVSTHCALSDVPRRLTPTRLRRVLDVTLAALHALGMAKPRVAVCGLNPHAGEGGILGQEDAQVIAPIIAEYQAAGHAVSGPWPGDTVFIKLRAAQFDAVVAMYHDQGHIPVKLLGFSIDPATGVWQAVSGVNITLGLPILRTSVDHGTAFDIAGTGKASAESMVDAIEYAARLVAGRNTAATPA